MDRCGVQDLFAVRGGGGESDKQGVTSFTASS